MVVIYRWFRVLFESFYVTTAEKESSLPPKTRPELNTFSPKSDRDSGSVLQIENTATADSPDRDFGRVLPDQLEISRRIPPVRRRQPLAARCNDVGEEEERDDQRAALLPDDVLFEILRRVPPRWLATSRCVCRAWRDAVDGRRLLRADLLPFSVAGLFYHLNEHLYPEFLSCPSSAGARAVSGRLDFLRSVNPNFDPNASPIGATVGTIWDDAGDWHDYRILDHCNGLLLLQQWVVNPATGWWATLPPSPAKRGTGNLQYRERIVYDPTVSPYYEVFIIPCLDDNGHQGDDPLLEESEWPPCLCKMHVFSSRSGCWEERFFARQGDAAGTVGEMRVRWEQYSAAYLRGTLYVCYKAGFVMRICLTDNTYRVIKSPMDAKGEYYPYLGVVRSEKGVYFVSLNNGWLRVWILKESCGEIEWMLKHEKYIKPLVAHHEFDGQLHGDWILEDINYHLFPRFLEDNKKAIVQDKFEINRDNDAAVKNEDMDEDFYLADTKKAIVVENVEWNSNDANALGKRDMVEDFYDNKKAIAEEKFEWIRASDDDKVKNKDMVKNFYLKTIVAGNAECNLNYGNAPPSGDEIEEYLWVMMLRFHPYKEIVFLTTDSVSTGFAYHLNSSKIEVLGHIYPRDYAFFKELGNEQEDILSSFPYTPCWIDDFPRNNQSTSSS